MTGFIQKVVTRDFFLQRPTFYACLQVFYVVGFGVQFLCDVARVAQHHDNKLLWTLCYTICNMHHYMIGDLLEDLVFRDLGTLGKYWHNWGFYGAPISIVCEIFALSHLFSEHDHGVYRDAQVGAITVVMEQG